MIAEAQGQVASRLARAEAELEVQRARVEQVRRQLQADVLEPARAHKAAAEAARQGRGRSDRRAGAGDRVRHGPDRRHLARGRAGRAQVFLMQKVDDLIRIVMGTVGTLKVERLTVLGGIGGASNGSNGAGLTRSDRQADRRQRTDQGRHGHRPGRRPARPHPPPAPLDFF